MKEYYYLDRIKEKTKYADYIQYELDRRVYCYGNQQKISFEKTRWRYNVIFSAILEFLIYLYFRLTTFFLTENKKKFNNNVLSTAYHGFNEILKKNQYSILGTPWVISKNKNKLNFFDFVKITIFKVKLLSSDFNYLISPEFSSKIEVIKLIIGTYISTNKIKGIFLPQDVGFFEKLIIDEARKKGIPSFVILHGAALRYGNTLNDNRADYLCVFGQVLKQKLVESGFMPNKIIISGHPKYSLLKLPINLRNDHIDVMVATKPLPGSPVEIAEHLKGRARDTNRLKDRGNLILYLMEVQMALLSIGVNKARLRIHPSESSLWYLKFIDTNFFSIDKLSLLESLEKSSLIIGPSSSLFFDSIFSGVNYMVYEPVYDDGLDILNDPVGYPFNGGDDGIPVAKNVDELIGLLKSKSSVKLNSIEKYISPNFDIKQVLDILK